MQIKTAWNYTLFLNKPTERFFVSERNEIQTATDAFITKYKDLVYLESPEKLKNALDEYSAWRERYGSGGSQLYYFALQHYLDQGDTDILGKLSKVEDFMMQVSTSMDFFELQIAAIPQDKQSAFLIYEGLSIYRHFLERLFSQSKHLLSEKEERIMSMKSKSAHESWVDMTAKFLAREERAITMQNGKKEKKSLSQLLSLQDDQNKQVRDSAAKEFYKILAAHADVAEAEMNAILYDKKVNDEIRGFVLPQESRLLADDVDLGTVNALVSSVTDSFPIPQKFYAFKAQLLGVKKLAYHERNIEILYDEHERMYSPEDAFALLDRSF